MLLIQEYISPFLTLPNVIKKSNKITSSAITEGSINITPIPPKPGVPMLCRPATKPSNDRINPIILHIIDIIFDILKFFIIVSLGIPYLLLNISIYSFIFVFINFLY